MPRINAINLVASVIILRMTTPEQILAAWTRRHPSQAEAIPVIGGPYDGQLIVACGAPTGYRLETDEHGRRRYVHDPCGS